MSLNIGIVGCGNSAKALAFYLSSHGHAVWMYVRNPEKHIRLAEQLTLTALGKMNGTVRLSGVTSDIEHFSSKVSVIFVATQATSYRDVASNLSPYIDPQKHIVILFSGKLLGCLDFKEGLQNDNKEVIKVLETDSIFASRVQEDGSIWIRGIKDWTLFGASRKSNAHEYGKILKYFFPNIQAACNLIHRGLTDFGAVAHAIISMANISKIDKGEDFYFYYDGLSENTICLLEEAEKEFGMLAKAYKSDLIPMKELLNRYYGCDTSSLLTAIRTVPNYRDSVAPKQLNHRYLQEDVSCTLVPMLELGEKAGIEMPTIFSAVNICSVLAKKNFKAEGRNLKKLGLANLSSQEILATLEQ